MDQTKKRGCLIIVTVLFAAAALVSLFLYIRSLQANKELEISLHQSKAQVETLGQQLGAERSQREKLGVENSALKKDLESAQERLSLIDSELAEAKRSLEDLNIQVNELQTKNSALHDEKEKLTLALAEAKQEKDDFKAKLSSVAELKKAIKEIKKQARRVGVVIVEKIREKRNVAIEGNKGYLIKDGKPTIGVSSKVKIEVTPLPQDR